MVLFSCKRVEESQPYMSLSFVAEMPQLEADEDTKAGISYVVSLKWALDDEIAVCNMSQGMMLCGTLSPDNAGSIASFSGNLTSPVNSDDKLLLLYSSEPVSCEGGVLSINFSQQNGGASGSVPFVVYKEMAASDLTGSSQTLKFSFLMTYLQVSVAGLPASTPIDSIEISGVNNLLKLSFEGGQLKKTSAYETFIDEEGQESDHTAILLTPEISTNSSGGRFVFFTAPEAVFDPEYERFFYIAMGEEQYSSPFPEARLAAGTNYRLVLAEFNSLESTAALFELASKPSIEGLSSETWTGEESFSLIDVRRAEILKADVTIVEQNDDGTASIQVCPEKKLLNGDYILISPALADKACDLTKKPIVLGFDRQDGTLDNVPMYMSARFTVAEQECGSLLQFEYLNAVNKVEVTDIVGSKALAEESPDSKPFVPSNFVVSGAEIQGIPSAVEIRCDGSDIVFEAVFEDLITLEFAEAVTTGDNDDMSFYFSCPAFVADSEICFWLKGSFDSFDNVFTSIKPESYQTWPSFQAGNYNLIPLTDFFFGEDEPGEGEGAVD